MLTKTRLTLLAALLTLGAGTVWASSTTKTPTGCCAGCVIGCDCCTQKVCTCPDCLCEDGCIGDVACATACCAQ